MRAVCRDISIKHQKRVFEVEHASDEPCESVAGKEISAGINKWKQPTLFEQRDKWNICILGDLDAGREVLSLLWLRLKIFSQNLYQRTRKARSVFFPFHVQQEDSDLYSDTSRCYITQCNLMKCDRSWKMEKSLWDSHSWGIHFSVCIMAFQVKPELQKSQCLWCMLLLFKYQIQTQAVGVLFLSCNVWALS